MAPRDLSRQPYHEARTRSGFLVARDGAVLSLNDPLYQCEAQSNAFRLCGYERLEQPFANTRIDTGAGILHPNFDHSLLGFSADGHFARGRSRVDRIVDEVQKDLT